MRTFTYWVTSSPFSFVTVQVTAQSSTVGSVFSVVNANARSDEGVDTLHSLLPVASVRAESMTESCRSMLADVWNATAAVALRPSMVETSRNTSNRVYSSVKIGRAHV